MTVELNTYELEDMIMKAVQKALQAAHHEFIDSGWLTLKEGAKYAGVSYNTQHAYEVPYNGLTSM